MTLTDGFRVGLLAILLTGTGQAALAEDASPNADEQCVAQCDQESDKCMSKARSEDDAQKCDDEYSKCLEKCR